MSHTSWDKHLKDIHEENQAFKTTVLAEARKAVSAAYDAMQDDEISVFASSKNPLRNTFPPNDVK